MRVKLEIFKVVGSALVEIEGAETVAEAKADALAMVQRNEVKLSAPKNQLKAELVGVVRNAADEADSG